MSIFKCVLLDYVVSELDKETDPKKIDMIFNLQPPTRLKRIQRDLGHFGWYQDIIKDYTTTTILLTNLIKKNTKYE